MTKELIQSVASVIPSKGTNAGKTMCFINGKYWSKQFPKDNETHVVLEEVPNPKDATKPFTNVTGFSNDTRMTIADKIALLKDNDPALAMAIAHLLK